MLSTESLGSSWGMTKNASRTMTQSGQVGDFYRDCPIKPDNDTRLRNSRIPSDFSLKILEFLGILDCQKPKVFICYFARALRKYQVLLAFFLSKKQARKID